MVKVGVVGASGYTGLELIKMLLNHPKFKLEYLGTSKGNDILEELHPSLAGLSSHTIEKFSLESIKKKNCELVFLALPHKTSMIIAKELLNSGIKVVDLSADYRLRVETYEKYYCEHEDIENLKNSVYGLIEYYREEIKDSMLVAGAGCYPTATLLGILPFVPYLDENVPIFIDAKSAVSGAGKKLSETTHFVTINDNIFAYNPLKHRHTPEISEKIEEICGVKLEVNFVPHLINATRGELVSIYGVLKKNIDPTEILMKRYKDERFVRVRKKPVTIKNTAGTHFCDIFATKNKNGLFVSSSIDNLLRGASSQALAAGNLMCGFDEHLGIPTISYVP